MLRAIYPLPAMLPHDWHAATYVHPPSIKLSAGPIGARTPDLRAAWGRTLLYLHMRVRPHTLLADDNLPILPCPHLVDLPFLGSPFAYPQAGTGTGYDRLQGIVRCGRLPRLRRREGSTVVVGFARPLPPSRQSRLSGEPPPQSKSARHILDSHLLQSTAALYHLLARILRQVLDLIPQSAS